jgi:hypothetical protein
MSPIFKAGLNGIGFAKTFPHVVAYAPLSKQGLALKHPYTLMGYEHVKNYFYLKANDLLRWVIR